MSGVVTIRFIQKRLTSLDVIRLRDCTLCSSHEHRKICDHMQGLNDANMTKIEHTRLNFPGFRLVSSQARNQFHLVTQVRGGALQWLSSETVGFLVTAGVTHGFVLESLLWNIIYQGVQSSENRLGELSSQCEIIREKVPEPIDGSNKGIQN